MKLPQSLTTVTPFSKILAGIIFFVLLLASFWIGMQYQQLSSMSVAAPIRENCDINEDGKCDLADFDKFKDALGKKRGDLGYNPLADANIDGVVTNADAELLAFPFPITLPNSQTYQKDELLVKGKVEHIDVTPMFVDGDGIIKVKDEKGILLTIFIPARETTCSADTKDFSNIILGDKVEVFGKFDNNQTTLCESPQHYIRKVQKDQTVCTQDAKLCPDGSAVGRTGPNCEFSLCP